ncbi:MAG: hypothetical protein WBM02_06320 [bacterium]
MFSKKRKNQPDDQVIMRVVRDGKERDITVKEFVLSLNFSLEALTSALIAKKIITPDDFLNELDEIQKAHTKRQKEETGGE